MRAFWIAFGVSAALPVVILLGILLTDGSPEGSMGVAIMGSVLAFFVDLAFLIAGIAFLFNRERRPQGAGLILGVLVGALVGFGACVMPMGLM